MKDIIITDKDKYFCIGHKLKSPAELIYGDMFHEMLRTFVWEYVKFIWFNLVMPTPAL